MGFFKQTFQLDCLLPFRIAVLEPDKGESEGQIFLPEVEVRKRSLQRDGIKKGGLSREWGATPRVTGLV